MPRPTDESLNGLQGQGFGATPGASENLGQIEVSPIHQLDVDGATDNARMLAAVFTKAGDTALDALHDKQAANEADGEAAQRLGITDPAKMQQASDYATGVKRVQVQQAAVTAAAKAHALFTQNPNASLTDTTDANGQTTPGLMSQVQGLFQAALPPGSEADPVTAKLVAPLVQNTMNEISGAAYEHQIKATMQAAEDSQQALLVHDASNPGANLFDPKLALDTLTKVYGNDPVQGREALVHVVGEAAVQAGQPGLIAQYLPSGANFGNGATLTPDNLAYLDGAKNRATAAQNKNNVQALDKAGMAVVQAVSASKDPAAALSNYMQMPGASPEFAKSLLDWTRSQGADKASRVIDTVDASTLQADIMTGKVTSLEQAQQRVASLHYSAGSAVQLITHAASWLDAKHATDESDPQFRSARDALNQLYQPGVGALGVFTKPEDVTKRANVLSTFITNYQQNLQQPNMTAADAARKASDAAQKQWGPPTASNTQDDKPPTDDPSRAAYLRNKANMNPDGLSRAGINATVIKRLRDTNKIDADTARAANAAYIESTKGNH